MDDMDSRDAKHQEDQFEQLVQGLIDQEFGCVDDFIDAETVAGFRANLHRLIESDALQAAGIGKKELYQKNEKVRGDNIKWIEPDSKDPYESLYNLKMSSFISYLNRTCFTSLNSYESHYASYEKNSFYKRHLDQFLNDSGRKFSTVLYLNDNWQPEDGGYLSLYPKNAAPQHVLPLGGRLVFFKSDEMEHEVHPSATRERMSIAGWLKG